VDDEFTVVPRRDSDPDVIVNRGRHYETVVVIGVFSDQVHPTWGAIHSWVRAVACAKLYSQVIFKFAGWCAGFVRQPASSQNTKTLKKYAPLRTLHLTCGALAVESNRACQCMRMASFVAKNSPQSRPVRYWRSVHNFVGRDTHTMGSTAGVVCKETTRRVLEVSTAFTG